MGDLHWPALDSCSVGLENNIYLQSIFSRTYKCQSSFVGSHLDKSSTQFDMAVCGGDLYVIKLPNLCPRED